MKILLHSSKTMVVTPGHDDLSQPTFLKQANNLASFINSLEIDELMKSMKISKKLATEVSNLYTRWVDNKNQPTSAAVECFRGDIYSGLRALEWNHQDQTYAQEHLRILSGLYGLLRPYDAISPYRLEAAYTFPNSKFSNLYAFWGNQLAANLGSSTIINLSSLEYAKMILPHLQDHRKIISPKFLTLDDKGTPKFVVVHAKIARGAFARWMIKNQTKDSAGLVHFNDLGYAFESSMSTLNELVFICKDFKGIGLSQRQK